MTRYLAKLIEEDLSSKMIFVSGPRQSGKTTMAKSLLSKNDTYINWDSPNDRTAILQYLIPTSNLVVFDELHRYKEWRNFLKGLYDERGKQQKFLVTGSARLDFYRYSGDTLQGRYFSYRLHPLSVKELGLTNQEELEDLLLYGGFPEPYYRHSERFSRRWSEAYRSRLIEEEIAKIEHIKDLSKLEPLMLRLPELVGSPLSINSLREDLDASHEGIARWIDIVERFFGIFRISPFGAPRIKAVKKIQKHYHYDWTLVKEKGAQFENFIASHLLKWIDYQRDVEGKRYELRYFRDNDESEVDFIITDGKTPLRCIECKISPENSHRGLRTLKNRFPQIEALLITKEQQKEVKTRDGIIIRDALTFLRDYV